MAAMLLASLQPSFYARFYERSMTSCMLYLLELVVVYEVLRFCVFIVRHAAALDAVGSSACLDAVADAFPAGLTMQVRNDRLYFSGNGPVIMELPQCVQDGLGLLVSYLSHGIVADLSDDLWGAVAPFVVFADEETLLSHILREIEERRDAFKTEAARRPASQFETIAVVVSQDSAVALDVVPATGLVHAIVRAAARQQGEGEAGEGRLAKMDRTSLRMAGQAFARRVKASAWVRAWLAVPTVLVLLSGGALVGLFSSLDLLITSTVLHRLVRQGWLGASFRFWGVRRHLGAQGGSAEALALEQELMEDDYRRAMRDGENVFLDVPETFFAGISIHTATASLILDAAFPQALDGPLTGGFFLHAMLMVLVVRYFALPGVIAQRHIDSDAFARRRAARDARTRERQAADGPRSQFVSSRARGEWQHLVAQQSKIERTLRSPTLALKTKLDTVVSAMELVQSCCYGGLVQVLHVWSPLCDGPDPVGGPGWCYGLSPTSGAWVLLRWYDHPCSELGIRALTAFPGAVRIGEPDDSHPSLPRMLHPSQAELDEIKDKLKRLESQLQSLVQPQADLGAGASSGLRPRRSAAAARAS